MTRAIRIGEFAIASALDSTLDEKNSAVEVSILSRPVTLETERAAPERPLLHERKEHWYEDKNVSDT